MVDVSGEEKLGDVKNGWFARNWGEILRSAVKGWWGACCCSCLMGGGGGRMAFTWLDTRLKERLSVSSSEKRSLRFMSKRGAGRRECGWAK